MADQPPGAGKSSFELIDSAKLFDELDLRKGNIFVDLGCGKGQYALKAVEAVGNEGFIYAIDLWKEGIALLRREALVKGIHGLKAIIGDITDQLPLDTGVVDVCLMASILHDLHIWGVAEGALREVHRVLRPEGLLAVVEFKKMEGPPGPPIQSRMTPEEIERTVSPYGFEKRGHIEIGPYNELMLFSAPDIK